MGYNMKKEQVKKAEIFLELHHSDKILILPNIWDILGAKLLEKYGFKAVATASSSIAFANGFKDGQQIGFDMLLGILASICSSTHLPVTADIERGYAKDNNELSDNIKRLIKCGVIGINIEDSVIEGGELVSIEQQCERIKLIRQVSNQQGIPLFINARCDIYLCKNFNGDHVSSAIERAANYKEAGADCFYPILCKPIDIEKIYSKVDLPVNVLATSNLMPIKKLEQIGISRLSLGPSLLKSAITKMREVLTALINYDGYESFTNSEIISTSEIIEMVSK